MNKAIFAVLALVLFLTGRPGEATAGWDKPTVYVGVNLIDLTLPLLGEWGDIGPALRPLVGAAWENDEARVYVGGDFELVALGNDADRITIGGGVGWRGFAIGGAYMLRDHIGLDGSLHLTGALGTQVTGAD